MPSPKLFFAHHQLPASQTRDSTHLVLEGRGEGGGGSTLLGRGEGGGAGNEGGEGSKLEHGCAIIGHKVSAIDIVLEPPCVAPCSRWRAIERDRADGSVQVALLALCTSQWKYIPPLPALLKELARYTGIHVPRYM